MPVEVKFYILLYFISACLGWCMEVICKLFQLFSCLPGVVLSTLCIVLCSLFLIDTCISVWALVKIRSGAERVEGDSTEAITASVRTLLQKESVIVRRALHAFPDARIYNSRLIKRLWEKKLARNAGGNE